MTFKESTHAYDTSPVSASRRETLKRIAKIAGAAIAAPYVIPARAAEPLYVNTWGGIWEEAAAANLFAPFTKETGIEIKTVSPVSFAKLAAQAKTGTYEFDVTTLGGGDIVRANDAGLIEKIDDSVVDRSKLAPDQVFQNGVASHAFSTIIAWRKDKYPNGGPQTWADFWDTKKFPGSRCLQSYAARVLPLALLADGVPKEQLYPMNLDRAFAALDRLKPNIRVWWTQGQQSQQLLRDGEIDAIGIWHSRTLELIQQKAPVDFTWNQGEIDRAYWVVSKGSPRAKAAWRFINSAVQPERLAKFCVQANYGPLNPKSFEYIKQNDARFMPTFPANYKNQFEQDVVKAEPQLAELTKRFERWVGR
jgi:putative spermidine/putrescine transport system substrate-binding protein